MIDETEARTRLLASREGDGQHCGTHNARASSSVVRSRALFAQMTGMVHLRRQAQRHPTGDHDAQPRLTEFTTEALPSPDLNEVKTEAAQLGFPAMRRQTLRTGHSRSIRWTSRKLSRTSSQPCPSSHSSGSWPSGPTARSCHMRRSSRTQEQPCQPDTTENRRTTEDLALALQASMLATSAERQQDIDNFIWTSSSLVRQERIHWTWLPSLPDSRRLHGPDTEVFLVGPDSSIRPSRPLHRLQDHTSCGLTRRPSSGWRVPRRAVGDPWERRCAS